MPKKRDYNLIPVNEKPVRAHRRGWNEIVKRFIDGDNDLAYIQLETKRDMHLAASAFSVASGTWAKGIVVTQYKEFLRVYLEKEKLWEETRQ